MATPRARPPHRPAGFTLVEVLVALLIMSVMAALGWQGVSGMARSRDIGQVASERTLRLSTLVAQWEQDLLAVYDSPQVPGLLFDGAALRLVRRVEGGVQVVVWALREGRWQRWASATITRAESLQQAWLLSQQQQGNEPGTLLLAEGVAGWQLYYWRGQGWSNAQSSADQQVAGALVPAPPASGASAPTPGTLAGAAPEANAAGRSALPTGVRLQIELPEGRLTRDIALAPQFLP